MFKDCIVKAMSGNTIEVIKGEPNNLLSSTTFNISYRGNNIYEFNKKPNTMSRNLMKTRTRKTVMEIKQKDKSTLKEDSKTEDVSQVLNVKPLLNNKQLNFKRKKSIKEIKPPLENEFNTEELIKKKFKDIKSIRIQGYFVNKLYE